MNYDYVFIFCRIAVWVVFLVSFVSKVINIPIFYRAVIEFRIIPTKLNKLITLLIVLAELIVVILLLFDQLIVFGLSLAIFLLSVFTIVIIITLKRGVNIECSCFGQTDIGISKYDVARNIAFIFCCFICIYLYKEPIYAISVGSFIVMFFMAVGFVISIIRLVDIVDGLWQPLSVE